MWSTCRGCSGSIGLQALFPHDGRTVWSTEKEIGDLVLVKIFQTSLLERTDQPVAGELVKQFLLSSSGGRVDAGPRQDLLEQVEPFLHPVNPFFRQLAAQAVFCLQQKIWVAAFEVAESLR